MSLLISRFSSQIPPNEKDYLTPIGICHSSLLSMPTLQNYYFCNLALFQFYAYVLVIVISEYRGDAFVKGAGIYLLANIRLGGKVSTS
jgi:hypothetical protein